MSSFIGAMRAYALVLTAENINYQKEQKPSLQGYD
jgi:hypothetical protein